MATHTILGGKVHVYKRPNSSLWQCSTYLAGRNRRTSTKQESLALAKEVVSDSWWKLVFGVAPDHDGCSIRQRGQSAALSHKLRS